mmetsp:Transcript_14786/g.28102  ORF Transcript_14786/g.28102 Transcript_14786/m.28102 type:complete len:246 (+) Transcript_14786:138-875(+)
MAPPEPMCAAWQRVHRNSLFVGHAHFSSNDNTSAAHVSVLLRAMRCWHDSKCRRYARFADVAFIPLRNGEFSISLFHLREGSRCRGGILLGHSKVKAVKIHQELLMLREGCFLRSTGFGGSDDVQIKTHSSGRATESGTARIPIFFCCKGASFIDFLSGIHNASLSGLDTGFPCLRESVPNANIHIDIQCLVPHCDARLCFAVVKNFWGGQGIRSFTAEASSHTSKPGHHRATRDHGLRSRAGQT